jgi:subtilase family serine protease
LRKLTLVGIATVAIAAAGFAAIPASASSGSGSTAAGEYAPVCLPSAVKGVAHCGAIQLLDPAANWQGSHGPGATPGNGPGKKPGPPGGGSTTPSGYYPTDIQSAYGLATAITNFTSGSPTVAVVDAYHDPNAATDLNTYRSYFTLPACGNGCFTQVNQTGGTTYPSASTSWSEEISLDLDMVSAACPGCHILLVEANSNSLGDLGAAVNYAAAHANVVSNSYGAAEFSGETAYDSYYKHSGVVITASAGDGGYGVEYPAASPFVAAVGGTTLTASSSAPRGWSETVWSGTGSGCSAYEANPGWQPATPYCTTRTVADTAADANPSTGVAVYDSYGEPGWLVFGGTSVSSPIIASVYALAGNAAGETAGGLYGASLNLNRVTSGTNARRCSTYLCNAADSLPSGYNGPTGNGTPNGTSGF